jgi:hypothetical protein
MVNKIGLLLDHFVKNEDERMLPESSSKIYKSVVNQLVSRFPSKFSESTSGCMIKNEQFLLFVKNHDRLIGKGPKIWRNSKGDLLHSLSTAAIVSEAIAFPMRGDDIRLPTRRLSTASGDIVHHMSWFQHI